MTSSASLRRSTLPLPAIVTFSASMISASVVSRPPPISASMDAQFMRDGRPSPIAGSIMLSRFTSHTEKSSFPSVVLPPRTCRVPRALASSAYRSSPVPSTPSVASAGQPIGSASSP